MQIPSLAGRRPCGTWLTRQATREGEKETQEKTDPPPPCFLQGSETALWARCPLVLLGHVQGVGAGSGKDRGGRGGLKPDPQDLLDGAAKFSQLPPPSALGAGDL